MKIGIIDYGAGNLQSVRNALDHLGYASEWIRDAGDLERIADRRSQIVDLPEEKSEIGNLESTILILPGQGEFGDAARNLTERGLWEPLRNWIGAGNPYFGICLGYQILFEESEEAPGLSGLGAFPGKVVRFQPPADDAASMKIPHMGWNSLRPARPEAPLWTGLLSGSPGAALPHAYFVHSFYPAPADDSITACTTDYGGIEFVSAIASGNGNGAATVVATQFHPEKSQAVGLRILKNYLESVGGD